ncbi:MAG: TlpA family protein disulfide reductase [Sphingomonas sp.]
MGAAAALTVAASLLVGAAQPKIGQPAPDFELTLIDGSKVTLDQFKGEVVVLNFWATWCGPCKQELPLLDRYYELQEKAGLKVFAVTTEDSVPIYQLKKLFAVMHITPAKRIKGPYDVIGGVPTNYVIGRDGVLRYAKAGAFDLDALNTVLVPLLQEPSPPPAT